MDPITSESCYNGTIIQRNYRKMTILFVEFLGKNIWELQHIQVVL